MKFSGRIRRKTAVNNCLYTLKYVLFIYLPFSVLCSCNTKKDTSSSVIIIEGALTGVPDGMIYLAESRKWKTPIDSTTIKNGAFVFNTKTGPSFSPFLAALHYWEGGNVKRLKYRNHTLGKDSIQYSTDAFYLEPGLINIWGNNQHSPYLRIVAGKENELFFKNQFEDFGWIANLDSAKRLNKIEGFKKTIRENANSFFLLESIFRSSEQYAKSELTEIFSLFNDTVRKSKEGRAYQNYLSIRPDDKAAFPNLSLLTPENSMRNIFDSSATINMLIFWASWCSPCRKEIPLLKEIEKIYNGTGLKMTSVSIDEKKEQWLKAVAYEKMNWLQVHVPLDQIDNVQNQFRFITIPLVIFTDRKGKEIKRFADYDPNSISNYETIIKSYIR